MSNPQFSFTRVSGNRKTGPIATSMTTSDSCPDSCALKGRGCYARFGRAGMHWRNLDQNAEQGQAMDLQAFVGAILALPKGSAFRHNVAGDIPDAGTLDAIGKACNSRLLNAWTYTHRHDKTMHKAIRESNQGYFTVNLSADSPAHADQLKALNVGPVVTVVAPEDWSDNATIKTPAGNIVVRCPAEYIESMDCASCMLCAKASRKSIVGFTAHGSGKNKAAESVRESTRKIINIKKG